jgi:hypothetical protein
MPQLTMYPYHGVEYKVQLQGVLPMFVWAVVEFRLERSAEDEKLFV